MGSPKRKEGEPFFMFKIRRRIENRLDKMRLKPRVFFNNGTYRRPDVKATKSVV